MFDPQNLTNLEENSGLIGDPNSWLSGHHDDDTDDFSSTHELTQSESTATAAHGGLDHVLFKNLVEIVPLVQSLIGQPKKRSSFTQRGSITYTKKPSRESLYKKVNDSKGRNVAQSIPAKKSDNKDQDSDNFTIFSSKAVSEKNDELVALREQVEDLQKKLAEKDELLISAEISKSQTNDAHAKLDELKHQAVGKDSLLKSTQLQLSDAKIKLADKQAVLEKLQWETMTSDSKIEKLQTELNSIRGEISSVMQFFEGLTENDSTVHSEDYAVNLHLSESISDIDELDDMDTKKMEEARKAYIAAVAATRTKQDEDSLAAAVRARLHLQSFVFRSPGMNF